MFLFDGYGCFQHIVISFIGYILSGIGIAMGFAGNFLCSNLLFSLPVIFIISPYMILSAIMSSRLIYISAFCCISNYIIISLNILSALSVLMLPVLKRFKFEDYLPAI